jgi:hypothetical protein
MLCGCMGGKAPADASKDTKDSPEDAAKKAEEETPEKEEVAEKEETA